MTLSSTLLTTAAAYLDALSSFDQTRIYAILSEKYEHTLGPASMGVKSPMGCDVFVSSVCSLRAIISNYSIQIKEAWPNEEANVVTVWAVGEGNFRPQFKQNVDEGNLTLHREYIFVLVVDSTHKVEKALEFVDTKSTEEMMRLVSKEP